MAYVAISGDLISRVRSKIVTMRNSEVTQTVPNIDKTCAIDASYLFNKGCWGEHIDLLEKIPKEWLTQRSDMIVTVVGKADVEGAAVPVELRASLGFSGMTAAYARPARDSYYDNTKSQYSLDQLNALPDATVGKAELLQRWRDTIEREAINRKWGKIEHDIVGFLEKCKSLNEAVKLFPGLKMYVDKDDIARMEKKVVRAPREELVAGFDTEGATAAVVAARLMGAV